MGHSFNGTSADKAPQMLRSSSEAVILEQINSLEKSSRNRGGIPEEDPNASAGLSSALRRAKNAEAAVAALRKQLADMGAGAGLRAGTAVAGGTAAGGSRPGAGIGADPAELRKLQKRIKELEAAAGIGGGSGGGAVDKKSAAAAEKKLQKALKEQETAARKEKVK